MNLFGKKKVTPLAPTKAIDKLRETLEMLEKREAFLDKQITALKQQAVKYVREKNKAKALSALKKSKLWEKEMVSISGQKFNLETQISALTQAITTSETIQAMRMGHETLAELETKLDPLNVADIMDELSETLAKVGEVTDAIARPIGPVMDDDELLNELELLVEPDLGSLPQSNMDKEVDFLVLPNVPKDKEEAEEELRKLDTIMNA